MRFCVFVCLALAASGAVAKPLTAPEKAVIAQAVSKGLKDPQAAQFRWTDPGALTDGEVKTYCGQVNAKNSYGAYVGYVPYMAGLIVRHGKVVAAIVTGAPDAPGSSGVQATTILCGREGIDLESAQ